MTKAKNKDSSDKPVRVTKSLKGGKIVPVTIGNVRSPAIMTDVDASAGIEAKDKVIFHLNGVKYAGVISAVDTGADGSVCLSLTNGLTPV